VLRTGPPKRPVRQAKPRNKGPITPRSTVNPHKFMIQPQPGITLMRPPRVCAPSGTGHGPHASETCPNLCPSEFICGSTRSGPSCGFVSIRGSITVFRSDGCSTCLRSVLSCVGGVISGLKNFAAVA
jgi:hypothetical protein